jgi:hypothetical protein
MEALVKRIAIFAALIILMIAGGAVTVFYTSQGSAAPIPAGVYQTADPEASVFVAADWQAQQFFLLVGFILFNLIGIGVTIALIMWFLSRQIAVVRATDGTVTESRGGEIESA